MTAVGAEELNFLVSQLFRVAVKFPLALGASHPKYLCHDSPLSGLNARGACRTPPAGLNYRVGTSSGVSGSDTEVFFVISRCRLHYLNSR